MSKRKQNKFFRITSVGEDFIVFAYEKDFNINKNGILHLSRYFKEIYLRFNPDMYALEYMLDCDSDKEIQHLAETKNRIRNIVSEKYKVLDLFFHKEGNTNTLISHFRVEEISDKENFYFDVNPQDFFKQRDDIKKAVEEIVKKEIGVGIVDKSEYLETTSTTHESKFSRGWQIIRKRILGV